MLGRGGNEVSKRTNSMVIDGEIVLRISFEEAFQCHVMCHQWVIVADLGFGVRDLVALDVLDEPVRRTGVARASWFSFFGSMTFLILMYLRSSLNE